MMMYLIEYRRGYETYHADDYQHALDQANDANPEEYIINVFQCIELGEDGLAVFPHEADDLCSHEGGESVTGAVIICDICGRRDNDAVGNEDYADWTNWNGETGNHKSCEDAAIDYISIGMTMILLLIVVAHLATKGY
jgi:hypothetical protein